MMPDTTIKNNLAEVRALYDGITAALRARGLTVTAMESCTAGLVATLLTDAEGSSDTFRGSYVTYSNDAKTAHGVPAETISAHGVYSEETARAMAHACREAYRADIGIGITGTAGNPDPANADSRPGEAFFAIEKESCVPDSSSAVSEASVITGHLQIPGASDRFSYKLNVAAAVGEALARMIP